VGLELFSLWLGESVESVRHIFYVARRGAPCIIFFDQLDAIAPLRSDADHEGTRAPQRVVNQLLSELDGMEQLSQVIVVGATNKVSMVDPAILRPGRFGVHLHVGLPKEDDRAAILRVHLQGATLAPDQNLPALVGRLVTMTPDFSGADLAFLTQRAKLQALDEVGFDGLPALALKHFEAVIDEFGHVQERPDAPTRVHA
jgi:transitional endoplasmic reticulum ATPase